MFILGIIFIFCMYSWHLIIPFNYDVNVKIPYCPLMVIYLIGIIFFAYLIYLLIKNRMFNYDIIFLVIVLWITNLFGYIYFNVFENILLSFVCIMLCIITIIILIMNVKKINKSYPIYLFILLVLYFYLLIILFKFI